MIRPVKAAAALLERMPDTPGWFDRHLSEPWKQYVALLLLGLALRVATFGDPNLHVDESFYFLVGQEMHHGALPYVDIWDRKPLGLFIIYYLIAGISTSVVAYQVVAWLFASTTAMVIALIARRWAGTQGAVLAGASYLFMINIFEGYGGQSPIFYNLFVATAALLLLDQRALLKRGHPGWRTFAAMALGGCALTIKQTTLFECLFFGLFVLWCLARSGVPLWRVAAVTLVCAILGALPTVVIGTFYYAAGHWPEWWQAMVLANLTKARSGLLDVGYRFLVMALRIYPYLALILLATIVARTSRAGRRLPGFAVAWILAGMLGVLVIPNFYTHYALPLLVPLAVAASVALADRQVGLLWGVLLAIYSMALFSPFNRSDRAASKSAMDRMADAIMSHDTGGGLFISDGPVYLYSLSKKHPLTPIFFPPHLNERVEKYSSPYSISSEVSRVLRLQPDVVVISVYPRTPATDGQTRRATLSYVGRNCHLIDVFTSFEVYQNYFIAVWGDCRSRTPTGTLRRAPAAEKSHSHVRTG